MKNLFNYTLTLLLGLLTITACTNKYEYDAPSATDQGGNATISTENNSFVFVPGDEQVYQVTITRVDATNAQEISLTCDNEKFEVPATVSFAAGEKSKDVSLSSSLVAGESEVVNISLGKSDAFLYGTNTIRLSVSVYRMFKAVIQSAFYGNEPWEVSIYELGEGAYKIPDAFHDGYDLKFNIDFKTKKVTIPAQYIDYYDDEYGAIAMSTSTATYDPSTLMITATSTFFLPSISYVFGTAPVYIVFESDPQK